MLGAVESEATDGERETFKGRERGGGCEKISVQIIQKKNTIRRERDRVPPLTHVHAIERTISRVPCFLIISSVLRLTRRSINLDEKWRIIIFLFYLILKIRSKFWNRRMNFWMKKSKKRIWKYRDRKDGLMIRVIKLYRAIIFNQIVAFNINAIVIYFRCQAKQILLKLTHLSSRKRILSISSLLSPKRPALKLSYPL